MARFETYYVCEGWQLGLHTVVVHRGECPQCNEGKGIPGEVGAERQRWFGPYSTANGAMNKSIEFGDVSVLITCRCVEEIVSVAPPREPQLEAVAH